MAGWAGAGGFGVLPLLQAHIAACFAVWGTLSETDSDKQPQYIQVPATLLGLHHPALTPWIVLTASPEGPWLGGQHLPEDALWLPAVFTRPSRLASRVLWLVVRRVR